jgi:hypothetical protein
MSQELNPIQANPVTEYGQNITSELYPSDSTGTTAERFPELTPAPFDKRPLIYGIIVVIVFFILVIVTGIYLFNNPVTAQILRDIFIIYVFVALLLLIPMIMVLIVALIYLVLKVNDMTQLINREIRPLLAQLQSTVSTARGTTTFLSEQAVKPVITTVSAVAGVRGIFRTLFRR